LSDSFISTTAFEIFQPYIYFCFANKNIFKVVKQELKNLWPYHYFAEVFSKASNPVQKNYKKKAATLPSLLSYCKALNVLNCYWYTRLTCMFIM